MTVLSVEAEASADKAEPANLASGSGGLPPIIVVDLDGTLLKTDLLFECLAVLLRTRPWSLAVLALCLFRGKAAFKRKLAELAFPDVETLPANDALVAWLTHQRALGREIHLYSASDQQLVDAVAARFNLFSSAVGSDGRTNLDGLRKLAAIRERFGDRFTYIGNGSPDLPILRAAASCGLAGDVQGLGRKLGADGPPVEATFPIPAPRVRTWLKAMRVHQWAKNTLVFVPLFLSAHILDPVAIVQVALGFLAFGLMASITYLFNDMADLSDDRRHATKHRRPFASGALPLAHGFLAAPFFGLGILGAAAILPAGFAGVLLLYLLLTLTYSIRLKRVPILDVLCLAFLFTLRILGGLLLIEDPLSPWLLTFSMLFFLSLAAVKRYGEWRDLAVSGRESILRRGYQIEDGPFLMAMGAASAFCSALVFFIYLVDNRYPKVLYQEPAWLWLVCIILVYWLARCWLFAVRGKMNDDPILFALRDRVSLGLGAVVIALFCLVRL